MHVIRRTAFKGTGVLDGMRAFLLTLVMILVISSPAMAEIFVPDALKHATDDHSIIQDRIEEDVAGYARVFTLVWLRLRQAAE
jgi:hypothetical protein